MYIHIITYAHERTQIKRYGNTYYQRNLVE
jgi:hypothetical protein